MIEGLSGARGRIRDIYAGSERQMTSEMNRLAARVQRLEQQNRFIKWTALGLLVLALVVSLSAQERPTRTIEAEKFVVRDSKGRARITIGTPQSSGAAVDSRMDEPTIWISDEKGMDRVIVSTVGLRLANDAERPAASLTFGKEKGAEILLYGSDGKLLYRAP